MTRLAMLVMATIGWMCAAASGQDAAPTTSHDRTPASRPPNFVFFLVDDLGWRDVGFMGSTFYETPHVDALAASGMVFTQAYAACQVCSPTRASIMTGKHPARLNTTDYFGAPQPDTTQQRWTAQAVAPGALRGPAGARGDDDRRGAQGGRLRDVLRGQVAPRAGGVLAGAPGLRREQGRDHARRAVRAGRYFVPYGNPRLPDGPPGEHLPDRLAGEAAAFIEAHRDEALPGVRVVLLGAHAADGARGSGGQVRGEARDAGAGPSGLGAGAGAQGAARAGPRGVRGDGRGDGPGGGQGRGEAGGPRPARRDGHHLHVRQRRAEHVGGAPDEQPAAAGGEGLGVRGGDPRADVRGVARRDEPQAAVRHAGDQHGLLPDDAGDGRAGGQARAARGRAQPRAAAHAGRASRGARRSTGTTRTTATRAGPRAGRSAWATGS
jgi:hypothetical protein